MEPQSGIIVPRKTSHPPTPAALVFFDLLCAVSPPKLNFLFHCTVSPFLIVTGVSVNQFSCAVSPPARVHEISLCGVPLSIFFIATLGSILDSQLS